MKTNMHKGARAQLFAYAQYMRNHPAPAEKKLWEYLRGNQTGYKFRRQHPLSNSIVDFYCHKLKFIIETDGADHEEKIKKMEDDERDYNLKENGYHILRFSNKDILLNMNYVMNTIIKTLADLQLNKEIAEGF